MQANCLEQKLMFITCGSYDNVIRWIPPLIVTQEQIEDALEIFDKAVQRAAAAWNYKGSFMGDRVVGACHKLFVEVMS